MSRRTSEASKAVREAWQKEQKLVSDGKGTRDWTVEQQQDIIEKGKAYDDDGRAFEGHHMMSAEEHPEFQGDPGNIQFLTRTEHLSAHGGSFQNPTNGFYNPLTGETKIFGSGTYSPCEVIQLSKPVYVVNADSNAEDMSSNSKTEKNIPNEEKQFPAREISKSDNLKVPKPKVTNKTIKAFPVKIGKIANKIKNFVITYRFEIAAVAAATAATIASKAVSGHKGNINDYGEAADRDDTVADDDTDFSDNIISSADTCDDEKSNDTIGTPKRPHHRRGYDGHRWKKNEEGELVLCKTPIRETDIHKDQME